VYVDLGAVVETLRRGSLSLLILAGVLVVPNVALDAWTWRELLFPMLLIERTASGGELHSEKASLSEKRDASESERNTSREEANASPKEPDTLGRTSNAPTLTLARRRLSFRLALSSVLAGYTAAFFTPARIGEFGGRALTLAPGTNDAFDLWDVSITVGAQRIVDTLVAVAFGWVAMAWVWANGSVPTPWADVALIGLGIGGAVVFVLTATVAWPGWIGSVLRAVAPNATTVHERAKVLRRIGGRTLLRVTIGCAVRFLTFAIQLTVLVLAFAPGVSLLNLAVGTGVTYYLKFLIPSLTFLDVGVREGAAILAFGWTGVPEAAALNASLMIFFINLALPAVLGAFFLKRRTVPEAVS
jgi:hypothetical protein